MPRLVVGATAQRVDDGYDRRAVDGDRVTHCCASMYERKIHTS